MTLTGCQAKCKGLAKTEVLDMKLVMTVFQVRQTSQRRASSRRGMYEKIWTRSSTGRASILVQKDGREEYEEEHGEEHGEENRRGEGEGKKEKEEQT